MESVPDGRGQWHEVAERILSERRSGAWKAQHPSVAAWMREVAARKGLSPSLMRRWVSALGFVDEVGGSDGWPEKDALREQRHFNIELLARLNRTDPEEARRKAWALTRGQSDRLSADDLKRHQDGHSDKHVKELLGIVAALGEPASLSVTKWPPGTWLSAPDVYLTDGDRRVAIVALIENPDTWRHSLYWALAGAQICTACWIVGPASAERFLGRAASDEPFLNDCARNIGIAITGTMASPTRLRAPMKPMNRSLPAEDETL